VSSDSLPLPGDRPTETEITEIDEELERTGS
jgi:hypothetical protein